MTPEERDAYLDEPLVKSEDQLYFNRDGTPCKTRREAFAAMDVRGPEHRVGEWLSKSGKVRVSTIFLCIDHGWGEGPPIIFETMVFGGPLDQEQWRYSTEAQALAGHARAIKWVKHPIRMRGMQWLRGSMRVKVRSLEEWWGRVTVGWISVWRRITRSL